MSSFLFFLAILPGLAICFLIFRLDRYEREPLGALVFCFILGMLSTLPAIGIQGWSGAITAIRMPSAAITFLSSFGVVAASEETVKCAVLLIGAFPRKFFNEPVDGVVYAVLVGMGFATIENLIYANNFGLHTTIVRAFTAVPAHFVFAIVQGYYIGLAKFDPERRIELILKGLGLSIFLHGAYDFLILQELSSWLSVMGSISVYICLYYGGLLVQEHVENSPFKS